MLNAVIFDFDGVIVDSEPLHHQAFQKVLKGEGIGYSWDEYRKLFIGFDDRDGFREMYRVAGRELDEADLPDLIERKAEQFTHLIEKTDIVSYPGSVALVRHLSGRVPLALCSGALRSDVRPVLSRLNISDCFDAMVTAEDVNMSKPDPESYLLALSRLGKAFEGQPMVPDKALAIEDTPTGITSARAAGLHVLALTNTHDRGVLDEASVVLESLDGMTLERLSELVAGGRTAES